MIDAFVCQWALGMFLSASSKVTIFTSGIWKLKESMKSLTFSFTLGPVRLPVVFVH